MWLLMLKYHGYYTSGFISEYFTNLTCPRINAPLTSHHSHVSTSLALDSRPLFMRMPSPQVRTLYVFYYHSCVRIPHLYVPLSRVNIKWIQAIGVHLLDIFGCYNNAFEQAKPLCSTSFTHAPYPHLHCFYHTKFVNTCYWSIQTFNP